MTTVLIELEGEEDERFGSLAEMSGTSKTRVVKSMALYCLNNTQEEWREDFFQELSTPDFEDQSFDESKTDLNAGARPESEADLPPGVDADFHKEQQEPEETLDDVFEKVDSLGEE